jgi:pyruvate carboxylase
VPVHPGQRVRRGDVLVTLEAMKMETSVRAERDATVKELLVRPGQPVDTKDLIAICE